MIPLATTTVYVDTVTEAEPGEGFVYGIRQYGVRAVISSPTGSEQPTPGGGSERIDAVLICDPIPGMDHTDLVTDFDGTVYEAAWVAQRGGLGLDHTRAGLVAKSGRVPGV